MQSIGSHEKIVFVYGIQIAWSFQILYRLLDIFRAIVAPLSMHNVCSRSKATGFLSLFLLLMCGLWLLCIMKCGAIAD